MKLKNKLKKALSEIKHHLPEHSKTAEVMEYLEKQIADMTEEVVELSAETQFPIPSELALGEYALFADGACRGNPGPGSWAFMIQASNGEMVYSESAVELATTNNRMELTGAIRAIEKYRQDIVGKNFEQRLYLFTDSRYVVDGMSKWVAQWKQRGWKKADNKAPENIDLWQNLDEVAKDLKIQFKWVQGHAGHPQNEYCDQLANQALDHEGF